MYFHGWLKSIFSTSTYCSSKLSKVKQIFKNFLPVELLAPGMLLALGEMCLLRGYFYRHSALLDGSQWKVAAWWRDGRFDDSKVADHFPEVQTTRLHWHPWVPTWCSGQDSQSYITCTVEEEEVWILFHWTGTKSIGSMNQIYFQIQTNHLETKNNWFC